jgi:hypothetical protein
MRRTDVVRALNTTIPAIAWLQCRSDRYLHIQELVRESVDLQRMALAERTVGLFEMWGLC